MKQLVISVHGIRTFGAWQERLEHLLTEASTDRQITVINYKYGHFSSLAFLIPPVRWLRARRFRRYLLEVAQRDVWDRIDLVGHSFGTYVICWSLYKIPEAARPQVHTIILAGSVLKNNFPWQNLHGWGVRRVVNDCGVRDNILLLTVFALFTGMAGRLGFNGGTSRSFRNRFFDHGHSGYFLKDGVADDAFMQRYWVPLLLTDTDPEMHDIRKASTLNGLYMMLLNNAEPLKIAAWMSPLIILTVWINGLRLEADRQRAEAERQSRIAIERQLEAETERDRANKAAAAEREARELAEDREKRNRQLLYAANMNLAAQAFEDGNFVRSQRLLNAYLPTSANGSLPDLRSFYWYYLWQLNHQELATFRHETPIYAVAFSPDSKILATGSEDGAIKLWDLMRHREITTLKGHRRGIGSVVFSPDGKTLASASVDYTVKLWDVATHKEAATLRGHSGFVRSVAFSPDGKVLATGSDDHRVKLWDMGTCQETATLKGHGAEVTSVAFSTGGKVLATGSWDSTVRLWDVVARRELATLKGHRGIVTSVGFSPDGKTIASGGFDFGVKLWDIATHRQRASLKGHVHYVNSVAFSPDAKMLATGSQDGSVKLWDLQSREKTLNAFGRILALSPDNKILVTGSTRGTLKFSDMATMVELAALKAHSQDIMAAQFSPDGKRLASGSTDGTLKLWDVATRGQLQEVTVAPIGNSIASLAFSPDGKILAAGTGDGIIQLRDALRLRNLSILKGHTHHVNAVAFSADKTILASGSSDGTVKLWDLATRREFATFNYTKAITSIAFSPDGKALAVGTRDFTTKLWGIGERRELATFRGHTKDVTAVAFSPDGKILVTGSWDTTVKLWDTVTLQELGTIRAGKEIKSLAFTSDGMTLIALLDGLVRFWSAATNEQIVAQR